MEIKQISPPSWSAWAVLSLMLLTDIYKQRYRDKQIFLWRCFISGLYFVHGNYCQTCYLGVTEMAGSAVQKAISCLCCKGLFGYGLGFWFLLFNYNLHGLDLGFVSVLGFFSFLTGSLAGIYWAQAGTYFSVFERRFEAIDAIQHLRNTCLAQPVMLLSVRSSKHSFFSSLLGVSQHSEVLCWLCLTRYSNSQLLFYGYCIVSR